MECRPSLMARARDSPTDEVIRSMGTARSRRTTSERGMLLRAIVAALLLPAHTALSVTRSSTANPRTRVFSDHSSSSPSPTCSKDANFQASLLQKQADMLWSQVRQDEEQLLAESKSRILRQSREIFDRLDLDGKGVLSPNHLATALTKSGGPVVTEREARMLVQQFDADGDGLWVWEEWNDATMPETMVYYYDPISVLRQLASRFETPAQADGNEQEKGVATLAASLCYALPAAQLMPFIGPLAQRCGQMEFSLAVSNAMMISSSTSWYSVLFLTLTAMTSNRLPPTLRFSAYQASVRLRGCHAVIDRSDEISSSSRRRLSFSPALAASSNWFCTSAKVLLRRTSWLRRPT